MQIPTMSARAKNDHDLVRRAQWWLAGKNRYHLNFRPGGIDGIFGAQTGRACQRAKWHIGYPRDECSPLYGEKLHSFLVPRGNPFYRMAPASYRARRRLRRLRKNPFLEQNYPEGRPWPFKSRTIGRLNGCPYSGTHTRGNWESDRAVDLNAAYGTPLLAIWDGVIGSQIGPIYSNDPALLGQRLHLLRSDGQAEAYYAHMSRINVHAGQHVKRGDVLGLSGSANGVPHLHIATTPMRPDNLFGIDGCE